MATKEKMKTDDEIAALLDQHIRFTTGYADSALSKERSRVLEYYDGVSPRPTHAGNSRYVSQDVYESVEALKATILEVFSTNQKIITFDPSGPNDIEPARIATEYCSFIVFRSNPGFSILTEVLEDGLTSRVGIVQYSWEEYEEETEGEIGPTSIDQLAAHPTIMQDSTSVDGLEDHEDGTYTASVTQRDTKGKVCLECVPPEDFGISSRAKDLKSAKLVWRRKAMTRDELLDEGYSAKTIDLLHADSSEFMLDQDKAARYGTLDTQRVLSDDTDDLESGRTYTVYYCYPKMDIDGTGTKLWHVVKCGDYILDKKKVSSRPFAAFVPVPKAHSFYGNNFSTKVIPVQNARSILTRSILDHAVITNAPRWTVVKGGLLNPKELMDNRVGGLVNVTRPDAVAPLMQAPLNPFVFQTIQLLDQAKEDTTGVSRLSKGLNREAVSTQNSRGLVEDLVSLSDRRQKIIARQFSEFLKELYLGIYQLVLDHQDFEDAIEVAGAWVNINPQDWRERTLVSAEVSVGYGETEKEVEKWVRVDQYLSQPGLAGVMYDGAHRYNVVRRGLEKMGVKDIDNVLVPLQKQQPPQPDPMVMAEVQLKQSQADAVKMQAQTELLKVQMEQQKWQAEMELKRQKTEADAHMKAASLDLKNEAQQHRLVVDAAEIDLQKQELEQATQIMGPLARPVG